MKPLDPKAHEYLADWVKGGGVLVFSGRDDDPFQGVQEWWNTEGNEWKTPSDHLFSLMGIEAGAPEGEYSFGNGSVNIIRQDPKEFTKAPGAEGVLMDAVAQMYSKSGGKLMTKNSLRLSRGPYEIVCVMDESTSDEPLVLEGKLIDLFDPELPVQTMRIINPGEQGYFYDIEKAPRAPAILACAGRAYETVKKGVTSFVYFYDVPNKKSVNITLESEEEGNGPAPVIVDVKGPNPIEFENGYVAFEDLPDSQRHLPGQKPDWLGELTSSGDEKGEDDDDEDDDDDDEDGKEVFDGTEDLDF